MKRYEPMKEFGRTTKKPKLDVSISRVRCTQIFKEPSPVKNCDANFWEDDDDDVILLATQKAETQAFVKTTGTASTSRNIRNHELSLITDSEVTFSEFNPNAGTSTQHAVPAAAAIPDDILSQLMDDSDFDALLATQCFEVNENEPPSSAAQDNFKKPLPPVKAAAASNATNTSLTNNNDALNVARAADTAQQNQIAARRQLASERQIKFLMERVDVLKKENLKLGSELESSKSSMQSKEGEVTLLRDELKHMKQQVHTLKMEKIYSTEAAKNESKTMLAELSKRVEAKETELQLKSMEYSVLKMRHLDETRRFRNNESMLGADGNESISEDILHKKHAINRKTFNLVALSSTTIQADNSISHLLFDNVPEKSQSTKKHCSLFETELKQLQLIAGQFPLLSSQQKSSGNGALALKLTHEIIESMCKVFTEFWSYVHSLEFPKNCRIHSFQDYDLLHCKTSAKSQNLLTCLKFYDNEKALHLRRYIAILSVLCSQMPALGAAMLGHQYGEYLLLQIAIDAITKLGFSRNICDHFVLLEAFADLLLSLLRNLKAIETCSETHVNMLASLLKHLIFVRPSGWVLRRIAFCLLEFIDAKPDALNKLCCNSSASSFVYERMRSIYRFSNDTCLMQVYCGLLEIAIPIEKELHADIFELLIQICLSHVRFVLHCFANPPQFIHNMLPSYDDDDVDAEEQHEQSDKPSQCSTSSNQQATLVSCNSDTNCAEASSSSSMTAGSKSGSQISCQCYTKMCLSVVCLLYQTMRQWIINNKATNILRIAEISKMSIQLLHIIFCDNYLTELLREDEETTKHYLWMLCQWWSNHAELLKLNETQLNFLDKLQNAHFICKSFIHDDYLQNIASDLMEWQRLTNDKLHFVNKEEMMSTEACLAKLQLLENAQNCKFV